MSDCKNCNPNCFERVGDDCIYVSVDSTELGIVKGEDSLQTALQKIINSVGQNQTTSQPETEDLGNVTSETNLVKVIHPVPFTLSVTPGSSSTNIMYDLKNTLPVGGTNIVNVEAFGETNNRTIRLFKSSSPVGAFTGSPENFPLRIVIDVVHLNIEGQQVFKFEKTISNFKSSSEEYLSVVQNIGGDVNTQADVNELLNIKVNSALTRVKAIEEITVGGELGLINIISDLQTKIKSLEDTIAELNEKISN